MYIGLLGGSFNPVHMGHLRLALEALEMTRSGMGIGLSGLDRVDMIPCSQPPHKPVVGLLPFDLRLALLRAAVGRHGGDLTVSDVEGRRPGPSYTWDTLKAYRSERPGVRLLFIVGGRDFGTLFRWYKGLELPRLADIAVVPRGGSARAAFCRDVLRQWPEARLLSGSHRPYAELPWGARILYLPLPRLDISASSIRRRWLLGRNPRFLLPDAVLQLLEEHRALATACWSEGARHNEAST